MKSIWLMVCLGLGVLVCVGGEKGQAPMYLRLGPMLGHTSATDARIWVKASGPGKLSVMVSEKETLEDARKVLGPRLKIRDEFAGSVLIDDLMPNTRYYYSVYVNRQAVTSPPHATFVTAPRPGEKGKVRFAFTSCSGYAPRDPAAGMADMGLRPGIELLLMLGDNHYADSTALAKQRKAYEEQRMSAGFTYLTSRIPTYGVWDDHDFSSNNSDSTHKGKETALQAFKEHWANPGYGEADNPGIYCSFSRGDVDFIMLDNRYYRSPNKAPDDGTKTMLGKAQLAWFKRQLLGSRATVKVIAVGGEWQSHGISDSWTSFKKERDEIFQFIEDHQIKGLLFVTGDRHFTAAYQVKGKFIEVTSGPLGGNEASSKLTDEMIMYQGKGRFYSVFDIDTRPEKPVVALEVYRVGKGRVENRKFSWDEVLGVAKIKTLKGK